MLDKIPKSVIRLFLLITIPIVVFLLGKIAIALGTPRWVVAIIDGFLIYWTLPQLVVWFRSNNQKNPKPRSVKGYWATKIDPGHGKLSMKAGVPNRLHPGPGYKFAGDNLEDKSSWIASERMPGESSGGGRLSLPMKFFDAWLHAVTGYRFIGRTVLDTISPTTELYLREIKREAGEFSPNAERPKDITDHVILAQQERPFAFKKAETSRAGKVKIGNDLVDAEEGVPLEGFGTYLLKVEHIWKVLFEIGGDELSLSKKKAEEGVREIIQGGIAEQFLGASGKDRLAQELAIIDEDKDMDGNVIESVVADGMDPKKVNRGTRSLFGFGYTKFILTDVDLEGRFRELYQRKTEERVAGIAALEAAERREKVAEVNLRTSKLDAQGAVAREREELSVLEGSALNLRNGVDGKGGLGGENATDLLKSRERRKGLEGFQGGTLAISEGGQPSPILIPAGNPAKSKETQQ